MLITGSAGGNTFRFSALTKELRNQGLDKAVTIYNLDAQYDAVTDLSRQVGGADGAKLINDMNIYGYSAAGQQDWRVGATEGDLVTQCNKDYDATHDARQGRPARAGTARVRARPVRHRRARSARCTAPWRAASTTPARTSPRSRRSRRSRRCPYTRQRRGQGLTAAARRRRSSTTCRRRCSTRRC